MKRIALALLLTVVPAGAKDNGQWGAQDEATRAWFNGLRNQRGGQCCSFADGFSVDDPDWEVRDGHYRVFYRGEWRDVPDRAVVQGNNRIGHAVLWPVDDGEGVTIRCFMPGSEI